MKGANQNEYKKQIDHNKCKLHLMPISQYSIEAHKLNPKCLKIS